MEKPGLISEREDLIPKVPEVVKVGDYSMADSGQILAVNLAINAFKNNKEGFMLADSMGVGKTFQILMMADQFTKLTGLRSLIVTQNESIIETAFKKDMLKLGFHNDNVLLFTYNGLSDGKVPDEQWGCVLYDEAHNLKNASSIRSISAGNVKAKFKVFATGTPMDTIIGSAYFVSEVTGMSQDKIIDLLGFRKEMVDEIGEDKKPTGRKIPRVTLQKGVNIDIVKKNVIDIRNGLIRDGLMIRREYPFWGTLEEVTIPMSSEQKSDESDIESYWDDRIDGAREERRFSLMKNLAGQKSGELSRYNEPTKLPFVINEALKEVSNGKKVIVIAEGINETEIKSIEKTVKAFILPFVDTMQSKGISVGKGYGAGKSAKIADINNFQSGGLNIIVGTPLSLSTGVDLDDQVGDKPRTMIVVTANYSGNVFQQILGRVSRRNTKSPAKVIIVFNDSTSDMKRKKIVEAKLSVLRAIQNGVLDAQEEMDSISEEMKSMGEKVNDENAQYKNGLLLEAYKGGFLVKGNTWANKDRIKSLGALWNNPLKAWFIPLDKKADFDRVFLNEVVVEDAGEVDDSERGKALKFVKDLDTYVNLDGLGLPKYIIDFYNSLQKSHVSFTWSITGNGFVPDLHWKIRGFFHDAEMFYVYSKDSAGDGSEWVKTNREKISFIQDRRIAFKDGRFINIEIGNFKGDNKFYAGTKYSATNLAGEFLHDNLERGVITKEDYKKWYKLPEEIKKEFGIKDTMQPTYSAVESLNLMAELDSENKELYLKQAKQIHESNLTY